MKIRQIFAIVFSLMFVLQGVSKNFAFDGFQYREILRIGRGSIESLSWHPEREVLAVGDGLGVRLYTLDDETPIELKTAGRAVNTSWNSEGNKLAVGDSRGAITIWNYPALEVIANFESPLNEAVKLVSRSPDGRFLAVSYFGSYHDYIIIWNTEDFGMVSTLEIGKAIYRVSSLTWNPLGTQIASGDGERLIIWDIASSEISYVLQDNTGPLDAIAWNPDNEQIAASGIGNIYIWDLNTKEISKRASLRSGEVIFLTWDSELNLHIGTATYSVYKWDLTEPRPTTLFELEDSNYFYVRAKAAWNSKTNFLAIVRENKIDIFDTNTRHVLKTIEENNSPFYKVVWSPNGDLLASVSLYENGIQVWDSCTGKLLYTLESSDAQFAEIIAWSSNGRLALSSSDSVIDIWDFSNSEPQMLSSISEPNQGILSISWSPDNQRLVGVGGINHSRTVFVWDVETGQFLTQLQGDTTTVSAALWSPTGERIATATYEGDIQIWDAESYEPLPTSLPHEENHFYPTDQFIWSPDGQNLAGVSCNQPLRECYLWIWNTSTNELSAPFQGISEEGIESLAWSPKGTFIASASANKVEIWDPQSGNLLGTIDSFGDDVTTVSWSPVDNMFATASLDGTIRIWMIE